MKRCRKEENKPRKRNLTKNNKIDDQDDKFLGFSNADQYSDQNSLGTGNQIKSLFDPVESKINGLVVIVCNDKDSTRKWSEELISKLGEDYEVSYSLPESKGPLLKVWGYDGSYTEKRFQ
jgi:hypothetical protein